MFENIIEFHGPEELLNDEEVKPVPASKNIPKWFQELPQDVNKDSYGFQAPTLKKCMPFLDAITAGYVLKLHQDVQINFNFYNEQTKQQDINISGAKGNDYFVQKMVAKGYSLNFGQDYHPVKQVGEKCPFAKQNSDLAFVKLINTWMIKTPPGYSTLYLPLINNGDERFTPVSGIVDTDDDYYLSTNFPIVCHKQGKFLLKKGTPIVSVFPFKRNEWKMKIKKLDIDKYHSTKVSYNLYLKEWYKSLFWKKKKWT